MSDVNTSAPSSAPDEQHVEKPRNGIAGFKHFRYDFLAGFVVSLVSLPLSSGIAIASGAPPIYGIISSIIAGLIFPFVGGSFVTISGPAAGLAPALIAIMVSLGGAGDADHVGAGYHMLLVVIFIVGIVQIAMAALKLARYAGIFPASVVEGMLGAIGVLILVKALPLFFGYLEPVHAHGFMEYLGEIPHWVAGGDLTATIIGASGLAIMLLAVSPFAKRFRLFQIVPPHIFAVGLGVTIALIAGLGDRNALFLIQVPANPLDGVSFPAFGELFARTELWQAAIIGVVTLTLIDGVESLATAQAIDRIDPFKRKSEPNKLLRAMGVSNVISSLVGGLTVIPGGVKSKTCIEAGGRTLWSNFFNATFLLVFLFIAPTLIGYIPKATLGGILVYTGWKMVHPSIGRHLAHIGREQVALYTLTIVVTLFTDLLVGVMVGTAAKLALVAWYTHKANPQMAIKGMILDFFRAPVGEIEREGGVTTIHLERPLVCFNSYKLHETLAKLPESDREVVIRLEPSTVITDHTATEALMTAADHMHGRTLRVEGLERMQRLSGHKTSIHLQPAPKSGLRRATP